MTRTFIYRAVGKLASSLRAISGLHIQLYNIHPIKKIQNQKDENISIVLM